MICITSSTVNTTSAQQGADKKSTQTILYKTGNPADWPKDQDAVIAAPENHKILMENDSVRVLEVTLLPGRTEPVHHHQWRSVLYITDAGDFIDRDGEGNVIFDTRTLPTPLTFPMTMWKGQEAPHSVENLSNTKTIRLIRIELKSLNTKQSADTQKNEVWQMEEKYWDLVKQNDTVSYKKLWHEDFLGYPSFGAGVGNKSTIASWIPKLHENKEQTFSYKLYKKGVNMIDDVVMVFYDADEIWTDKQKREVKKETFKFTHTWKKYGDSWLIIGGMAGRK